jgi:hypothetical protein
LWVGGTGNEHKGDYHHECFKDSATQTLVISRGR